MKRLFKIISIIVMLPFVIYFWPASYGGDTTVMMVQGQSMLPTILPGSIVVAKEAPEYFVDDIVAYEQREGQLSKIVVHRIIGEHEKGFIIQGDNNGKKDTGYPSEEVILGKVLFAAPYVGDILSMFRNPLVMVVAAGALFGMQMVQKNRKENKEKRKCLRLGIPYVSPKQRNASKKPKKPDFSMFFAAIFFNVLTFILVQLSIQNSVRVEGDFLTGFLYRGIIPELASVLIFVFYFGIIFGLLFLAKSKERRSISIHSNYYASLNPSQKLMVRKRSNPMLKVASIGWLLFIIMSMFHVMLLVTDLAPRII